MSRVGHHGRLTPVHLFTVEYPDGSSRTKAIPGQYCDITRCRDHLAQRLPAGAKITGSTWRPDYADIDKPANSQPDYQDGPPVICGLLAYYDESPTWLRQLVESLPIMGVTRLVAVDGAYALYPGGQPTSPQDGHKALRQACQKAGIQLHHHTPDRVWEDELEKRSFLFELGETVTEDHDWFFVVDADERVTQAPKQLPQLLDRLDTLVAECLLWDARSEIPLRMLFRAKRGLRVVGNHYTYQLPDGRRLWGDWNNQLELATPIDVLVEHRDSQRTPRRRDAKFSYYARRDRLKPEERECAWCGEPASQSVPMNWRWSGPGLVGDRTACCDTCYPQRIAESRQAAEAMGVNPGSMQERGRMFR